jgi:hypothetical protein
MSMRVWLAVLLLAGNTTMAQTWMGEIQVGVAGYNGDLTQKLINLSSLRQSLSLNAKYTREDFLNFRAGISWGTVTGNDKFNKDEGLRTRNLSFTSQIIELHTAIEANLLDPEQYSASPYVFAGIGVFHFNPYAKDNDGKKIFLKGLGTEGQGVPEYKDRKPYSLFQFCVPFGIGMKWEWKKGMQISYELGYRILFTDYLDDVSKTYVDVKLLESSNGRKAVEMAYRRKNTPFNELGEARGNPKVKDLYYFSGIKLSWRLEWLNKNSN